MMSDWLQVSRDRRAAVTIPTIWAAAALSLLVHVIVLWGVPRFVRPPPEKPKWDDASRSLSVSLVPLSPPPAPPRALALPGRPSPDDPPLPRKAARPRPAPPVIAMNPPAPGVPAPEAAAPRPSAEGDLWSYVEAKRRARGESALSPPRTSVAKGPPVEDENARSNSNIASNLDTRRALAFGYDPAKRGGAFQIRSVSLDHAEFIYYGWDKEVRRNMARLVEVKRGGHSDIRFAVVRAMIAIIREYEQGDFLWESSRAGRNLTLSARPVDNGALEEFMMREFFGEMRMVR
jgi:hypothetical protein